MDGCSGLCDKIKSQLKERLQNIVCDPGTNNTKYKIVNIVDKCFKNFYASGVIEDYSYSVNHPQESEYSVESILKGGPRTYWVNYSIRYPNEKYYRHDSITVYPTGVRFISSASQMTSKIGGKSFVSTNSGTISSDGQANIPDYSGVDIKIK